MNIKTNTEMSNTILAEVLKKGEYLLIHKSSLFDYQQIASKYGYELEEAPDLVPEQSRKALTAVAFKEAQR